MSIGIIKNAIQKCMACPLNLYMACLLFYTILLIGN